MMTPWSWAIWRRPGDQEFPADDNDGDPERAQPGGRQVDESRGDGYFIRQG